MRVTDQLGTGGTQNLEVDLGNISAFTSLGAGQTLTLTGLTFADLSSIYGSNWATRSDLVFGAIAGDGRTTSTVPGFPVSTIWATQAETTPGTPTTPYNNGSHFSQNNAAGLYETMVAAGQQRIFRRHSPVVGLPNFNFQPGLQFNYFQSPPSIPWSKT